MIGYYVHHQGSGHLSRAMAVAPHLPGTVVGLSSLPRPDGWVGDWVVLPRDDDPAVTGRDRWRVTGRGRLHWAPLQHRGLRGRMHLVSDSIEKAAPAAFVVDQSVEICLLARLHGVAVVGLTAPGRRGDPAHTLGFDVCTALVGAWPPGLNDRLLPGVPAATRDRFTPVGACSRIPVPTLRADRPGRPHVVVMAGTGGDEFTPEVLARAQRETPRWRWTVLSRSLGTWRSDPERVLATADVAVIHAGQNSLAEVAALRVPAVVVPQPRPHDEQVTTAAVLRDEEWPSVVLDQLPARGWAELLERTALMDGQGWERWCDGRGPERIGKLLDDVIGTTAAA